MSLAAVRCPWLLLTAVLLTACSGGGSALVERLDERAGVMLMRDREPLVFARTEPRYSRSTRDYLYLGAVETNRQGVREYFLWVGVATTLDRGFIAPLADLPRTLYVNVDGEPIELPLEPWRDLVRTSITDPVYATAVPLLAELAARVTLQQLTMFDADALATVATAGDAAGAPRTYVRWDGAADLGAFLRDRGGSRQEHE